jgi:Zn-finger nucleic acid-binding protein
MEKLKPVKDADLVLDYCRRCGGVWFDSGEVASLRKLHPKGIGRAIELRESAFRMPCHSCHAPMDRNAPACPACDWKNILSCPTCEKPLERLERDGMTLDVCRSCQGVWFDNHELADIWNMEVRRNVPTVTHKDGSVGVADYFLLDAVLWAPDLVFISAHGLAHGAASVAGGVADVTGGGLEGVAEVAGGAVEGVTDAASGVFEVLAEIIAGIF